MLFWMQLISTYEGGSHAWPENVNRFLKVGSVFNLDFAILSPGKLHPFALKFTDQKLTRVFCKRLDLLG
jgi:hypothetical protein